MRVMQQLPDDTTTGGGGLSTGDPNWLAGGGGGGSTNITDPSNQQWAPFPSMGQGAMPDQGYTPQPSTWLSNFNTNANEFLSQPTGQMAAGAAVGGLGLLYASQAQRNAQNLTNAISATARPGQNMSDATYRQMMGGPQMPGPMGQGVAGATTAANALYGTAGRYGTGNLTPAQQLAVSQNEAAQNASMMTSLGGPSGMGLSSSAAEMMKQQNANNALLMTQQMQMNNVALANAALQGANTTYDTLLGNALKQAGLGFDATANAVKQQLAANQQVATAVQQLMQSIVSGYMKGSGNQQPQPQPGGGGAATGGGAVAQQGGGGPNLMQTAGNMIGNAFANYTAPQVDTSWMQTQDPMSDMNVQAFNPLTQNG